MAIDVDQVLTDADLEGYVAGEQNLQNMLPAEWLSTDESKKTAKPARQQGLTRVLYKLSKRTPPITEDDLEENPAQLKVPVAYATLDILYRALPLREGSANLKIADYWAKLLAEELEELVPVTDDDGGSGGNSPLAVSFERG